MPDKTIDRLQIELTTNYKDFVRDLGKTEDAIGKIERDFNDLESASGRASSEVSKTGDAAKTTAVDLDNVADAAKGVAKNQEDLAQKTKKANDELGTAKGKATEAADAYKKTGDKVESVGDKSKTASSETESLAEKFGGIVTGHLATIASLGAIAGAITAIADEAIAARNEMDALDQSFTRAYGLSEDTRSMIRNLAEELPQEIPGLSAEMTSSVASALASTFPSMAADEDTLRRWTEDFASFAIITDTDDMESFIATFRDTVKKYNMQQEEYSRLLDELAATQMSIGPTASATDLISILKSGDMFAAYSGMDAYGVLDYYGEAVRSGEEEEARSFIGSLEGTLVRYSSRLGKLSAEKYIQSMMEEVVRSDSLSQAEDILINGGVESEYAETIAAAIQSNKDAVSRGESIDAIVSDYLSSDAYTGTEKLAAEIAAWLVDYSTDKATSLISDQMFKELTAEMPKGLTGDVPADVGYLMSEFGLMAGQAQAIAEGFAAANAPEWQSIKDQKLSSLSSGRLQYLKDTATNQEKGEMMQAGASTWLSRTATAFGLNDMWAALALSTEMHDITSLRMEMQQELLESENQAVIDAYNEYYQYLLQENIAGHIKGYDVEKLALSALQYQSGEISASEYEKTIGGVESSEKYGLSAFFSGRYGRDSGYDLLSISDFERGMSSSTQDIVNSVEKVNDTLIRMSPEQNIYIINTGSDMGSARAIQLAELATNRQFFSPMR